MEKQGMDRRNRIFRFGLLAAFAGLFLFCFVFRAAAQEAGFDESGPLEVTMSVSPQSLAVFESFTITILANHPDPSRIRVEPPELPPGLILERVRTEARNVQPPAGTDEPAARWTSVELLFTPQAAFEFEFGPFEVITPEKEALTQTVWLNVRDTGRSGRRYAPVFRWEAPPSSLEIGGEGSLVLALSNWDPGIDPPEKFFAAHGPKNAIMEEPAPAAGTDGIIRYNYKVIPLAVTNETSLNLEAFGFQEDVYFLLVPQLAIRLSYPQPPVPDPPPPITDPQSPVSDPLSSITDFRSLFPDPQPPVFPLFKRAYAKAIGNINALWEDGLYARALAELRRNERDGLLGPYYASFRRELEKNLYLSPAEDESWQFWKKPVVFLGFAMFIIAILYGLRRKRVTFNDLKSFNYIVSFAGAGILALLLFLGVFSSGKSGGNGQKAVAMSTPTYRVPDKNGAVSAQFLEGELVYIRSAGRKIPRGGLHAAESAWVYAESADAGRSAGSETGGKRGWIQDDAVIIY